MKTLYERLNFRPSFMIELPFSLAFPIAYFAEAVAYTLKPFCKIKLTFTIFRMKFLSTNRYFDVSKAKDLLGYKSIVSLDDGINKTVEWLKTLE